MLLLRLVSSLQRLSTDLSRSSEALKIWGIGEGDDLGDILTHSSSILSHISNALSVFASHEQTVREHMKAIRTREEKLDETRSRRRAVGNKAETAEKKLSKMGSENKNLATQTETLNSLRDEMRRLDSEIMTEEARIGDFKRKTVKSFMILKLGGLAEFAEKATIVGEIGRLMLDEIPLEQTTPGQGRPMYMGREKTDKLEQEVARCVGDVIFAGNFETEDHLHGDTPHSADMSDMSSAPGRLSSDLPYTLPAFGQEGYAGSPLDVMSSPMSTPQKPSPMPEISEKSPSAGFGSPEVGENSSMTTSPPALSPNSATGPSGGKFSTFPVRSARSGSRSYVTNEPSEFGAQSLYNPYDGLDLETSPQVDRSAYSQPPSTSSPQPWLTGSAEVMKNSPSSERERVIDNGGSPQKAVRFISQPEDIGEAVVPQPETRRDGSDEVQSQALYSNSLPTVISSNPAEPEHASTDASEDTEEARNLAAAREVSRELDALHFNPPPIVERTPSPLLPPSRPFANRSVSPGPPPVSSAIRESSLSSIRPGPRLNIPSHPSTERQSRALPSTLPSPQGRSSTTSALEYGAPSGVRTISAGAFKRNPVKSESGDGGTSPLRVAKRALPTSPYPPHRQPSNASMQRPLAGAASPSNFTPIHLDASATEEFSGGTNAPPSHVLGYEGSSQTSAVSGISPTSPHATGQAFGSPSDLPPLYQSEDGHGPSRSPVIAAGEYGRLGEVRIANPDPSQRES